MARRRKQAKVKREASIDAGQLLMRDLSRTGIWISIGVVIMVLLGVVRNMWF